MSHPHSSFRLCLLSSRSRWYMFFTTEFSLPHLKATLTATSYSFGEHLNLQIWLPGIHSPSMAGTVEIDAPRSEEVLLIDTTLSGPPNPISRSILVSPCLCDCISCYHDLDWISWPPTLKVINRHVWEAYHQLPLQHRVGSIDPHTKWMRTS